MHSHLSELVAREQRQDLERQAREARLARKAKPAAAPADPLTLRLSSPHDEDALARLGSLDGHRRLTRAVWCAVRAWGRA